MHIRNETQLKLYVRGFFGSSNFATETEPPKRTHPILSIFNLQPEEISRAVCNEGVVEIYNQLIRRRVIHTDFDYRERVIKIALRAFGVGNLGHWLLANQESPTFTPLHVDFLEDTVDFITTGKRKLGIDTWQRMVEAGTNDPIAPAKFRDGFIKACTSQEHSHIKGEMSMTNIHFYITRWLEHPNGFSDLVTTLYILFGESNNR